ncbi:TrmH family RNA methyltransferase [Candidatus Azobacteroides pseudotrichonymphae]|uniref:23S rRNA (Guanosine-2'-O-)-methyltransferase n=1 Tax=Azobacteroides pseudotrichonymphae genomovar. CFP2 TaxID=511995 RepID=B6YR56_AZOPC|nr:RNA methyltransferase [Candidatus Azobacteroides pseudotrichonymphae]BAG83678.1 23S rRNA (guanosine-2'-O-)-methyltransferase [Candidatus Azobacteroides pseudotrichonymphae genomovar. CFP2]
MKSYNNKISRIITSTHNPRIKNIQKLRIKAYERKSQKLFIIEGIREFNLSLVGNYILDSVYICFELLEKSNSSEIINIIPSNIIYEVSKAVFQKIACRENHQGILALAKPKLHLLADLNLSNNPLIIVLESIEKPGNLGAILRTAEAAKIDATIICNPSTDIYNPNVVRSSIGCLFSNPIAVASNEETLAYLKSKSVQIFAAELTAFKQYYNTDFTSASAIVIGAEVNGLTNFWLDNAHQRIKIPMQGIIDSLNVSVSVAIITFEAIRQRNSFM